MKIKFYSAIALLALTFPMAVLAIQINQYKQIQVSKAGHVPKDGFKPKDGFVPNEKTAIGIALIILASIYGADQIETQKPFTAELRGDVWVVRGSMEHGTGTAEVNISKRTGAVLRVIHGK